MLLYNSCQEVSSGKLITQLMMNVFLYYVLTFCWKQSINHVLCFFLLFQNLFVNHYDRQYFLQTTSLIQGEKISHSETICAHRWEHLDADIACRAAPDRMRVKRRHAEVAAISRDRIRKRDTDGWIAASLLLPTVGRTHIIIIGVCVCVCVCMCVL